MNAITQTSTPSNRQDATSVSTLDTQTTAQNDISIVMLPVSQLVVSDLNVRKSKASKSDDESLQASILAHGIIQNLVALPCEDDVYPVVSGGRRLNQLNALDAEEKYKQVAFATSLMLVPCLVGDSRFSFEFLYQQLDFDAADYWRPSTDNFVKRIDKDSLIEIARPVMSETWLQSAQGLKKGDLVKQLDTWLNGRDESLTEV
ncbi:ParB N-terminal domain-containing protein [Vibrio owensii]|uniref:ParB N-terminal domain-containing protein n=1 Tax=Vibrio owensii TaxID=696485 RepID=UPI00215C19D5|nr:ParB N-terminal domain-containing protein [Vibrio owensii]MCR9941904.1 ParB N-terminal domain-containing protein [Vibrio owensii]